MVPTMTPNVNTAIAKPRYISTESWQDSVPNELLEAVEPLREAFETAHFGCGATTRLFGYAELHKEAALDESREHLSYLLHMQMTVSHSALTLFKQGLRLRTEASIFKAFYTLYLEGTGVEALRILGELIGIGLANARLFRMSPLAWAEAQTNSMIRQEAHTIRLWVQSVCDKQPYDPDDSPDELLNWRKWQAPAFLIMKPNGTREWNVASAWERNDPATSVRWLDHFEDDYVQHLEHKVRQTVGRAALEHAKVPQAAVAPSLGEAAMTVQKVLKHRKVKAATSKRQAVIFGALQACLKARKYCKMLDDRNLLIPQSWIDEGCPATYSAAYVVGAPWRRKVLDEKTRYTREYKKATPAEREKLVQPAGVTRRTR